MPEPTRLVVRGPAKSEIKVYLTPEMEKDLDRRLARIEGHVSAVRRMLAEHRDCESLLVQMAAVRAAMSQVISKTLEGHIETCVNECVATEEGAEALGKLKKALATVLKNV
ncbi:MAG: metal-sensing transcriptional repressor [Ardenticatenaceae bacterium]|nr:metal-sensing transcriptional repressor [Ardenticatenaceae bacterium]